MVAKAGRWFSDKIVLKGRNAAQIHRQLAQTVSVVRRRRAVVPLFAL
jgi:hypothetical protein